MTEIDFIAKTPRLAASQDYALLRSEGLRHIESLARELWTDYNVHDPGVTLLEVLCYAITELGYRTGYDVADLMTEVENGVAVNNADFHTAREALTNHPVSFDDLRKLMVDVDGVRNAWIERHHGVEYGLDRVAKRLVRESVVVDPETVTLNGLYDVYVEYEDSVEDSRLLRSGLAERGPGGDFVLASGKGIGFDADYPLTLIAVCVYPQNASRVRIALEDSGGAVVGETEADLPRTDEKNRVPLGFEVPPGQGYRLRAYATDQGAVSLYREKEPAPGFPHSLERLLRLTGGLNVQGESTGPSAGFYFFFYDWEVSFAVAPSPEDTGWPAYPPSSSAAADEAPPTLAATREDVRLAILDRLHRHRNLCEDFVRILDLEKEEVALCADLELRPDADIEEVLAEVYFKLDLHVSPTVRFYSVDELAARGKTVDEIFEGPPLAHGFIDEDELRSIQRRCEIRTSDVIRILMDVEGVLAVRQISLLSFVDGEFRTQADWRLELATDRFRAPELSFERSKVLFYKDGLPYFANKEVVFEHLAEKRSAAFGSKLAGQTKDLSVPAGELKDVAAYEPVQKQLPPAYGVGAARLPASTSTLRQAQATQLKAYLMLFEQLLANHLAQLAHVRELFSWNAASTATYFTQEVVGVAGSDELYNQQLLVDEFGGSLETALAAIAEDDSTAVERKGRFLDHLLARFAEDLTEYGLLMEGMTNGRREALEGKRALLADLPLAGGRRGAAHDYRSPADADNLSGFARRVYRLLGIRDVRRRPLAGHRFRIEELPGAKWRMVLDSEGESPQPIFIGSECDSENGVEAMIDSSFELGGDAVNYRETADGSAWELAFACPGEAARVFGVTSSYDVLDEVVDYFARAAAAEGFHVVEHVLLRPRSETDGFMPVQIDETGGCPEVRDPYSFRATVVLPVWPRRFRDARFRRFVEETLRREAPAHDWLKICWISHQEMKSFEQAYQAWQQALAAGESDSAALARLIDELSSMITVYPLARLHDCQETDSSAPQITLNRTNLGTS